MTPRSCIILLTGRAQEERSESEEVTDGREGREERGWDRGQGRQQQAQREQEKRKTVRQKPRSESKGAVCKGDCDGNVIREVQCMALGGGGAESVQEAPSASNLG